MEMKTTKYLSHSNTSPEIQLFNNFKLCNLKINNLMPICWQRWQRSVCQCYLLCSLESSKAKSTLPLNFKNTYGHDTSGLQASFKLISCQLETDAKN